MRFLTAGESHGKANISILEGFPKGVTIKKELINNELKRRMSGYGRGKRMSIEKDKVVFLSGLRNKVSLGTPIAMAVENKDAQIFADKNDKLKISSVPRPAHADFAGSFKYQEKDLQNILERASARETAARVCAGAVCKQFLFQFGVQITSFTVGVGDVSLGQKPKDFNQILKSRKKSLLSTTDKETEKAIIEEIDKAKKSNDTLGGKISIWVKGVPPGIGSFSHFDRRLDAKIAYYLMSIPAVKGVEIGLGFEYAKKQGSESHDAIYYKKNKGFYRKTNNSGGIEGGVSNGEQIIATIAMKPIATLREGLDSVDLVTKEIKKAPSIRSDVCAVVACGVVAESMCAMAITESFLDKFGSDSLEEIKRNYKAYLKTFPK